MKNIVIYKLLNIYASSSLTGIVGPTERNIICAREFHDLYLRSLNRFLPSISLNRENNTPGKHISYHSLPTRSLKKFLKLSFKKQTAMEC